MGIDETTVYTKAADIENMVRLFLAEGDTSGGVWDIEGIVGDLIEAADRTPAGEFINLPDGDDFWEIVLRHDNDAQDDDAYPALVLVTKNNADMIDAREQGRQARIARDQAIVEAIDQGASRSALGRRIGKTRQAVSKIYAAGCAADGQPEDPSEWTEQ